MSRSTPIVVCLVLVAALTVWGLIETPCAEAQRKIVNIAAKEPDTLDPHSSTLGQSQAIARFMFRGLTRFAIKDGKVTTAEVEPDLAESWTLSPEGTIWTLKLRKGVQFHKGYGELTAEDVKFSFERQINKAPGTRYGVNLDVIKSIEVVNPYTLQIALKSFDPIFLLRMVGYQNGYIISKKAAEKLGDQFKWSPVGTGPFSFERHSPRDKIVLKAFDKFYGGRPQIDEVHWYDVPEDATKLIGLEKGTFDLLYPEAVTADFADQEEDGRGHRSPRARRPGTLLHQHDQAALRRYPRPQGVHARDRSQGHQGDHVSRRARAGGDELPAPRLLRPHPDGVSGVQPGGREEAPGRGGPPERLHDQELLHQPVVLLPEGAHPGPGAAPEGRYHRGAPARRPRDLPREHPEEPRPLRALRRHPDHRRRSVALAVLRLEGDPGSGDRQQRHQLRPLPCDGRPADRGPGRAGREEARGDLLRGPEAPPERPGVPAHQRRARAVGAQPQAREHPVRSRVRRVLAALQLQLSRAAQGHEVAPWCSTCCAASWSP